MKSEKLKVMRRKLFYGLIFLLLALAGCSRKTTVPIAEPVVMHDTVYQNAVQHDSVYVDHFVEVSTKGDTVFKTQTEYIYREKQIHDTTLQVVNVPYTVVKTEYVEKNLTWVQKKLMHLGWVFIAVCVVVLVIWGVKLWRKR